MAAPLSKFEIGQDCKMFEENIDKFVPRISVGKRDFDRILWFMARALRSFGTSLVCIMHSKIWLLI